MPRDAAATKASILSAAIEEFSRHGFSGARVDRIADATGTSKRMIYIYYGDKACLYVAALASEVSRFAHAAAIPADPKALPDYTVALFDFLLENPRTLRMHMWRHLELQYVGEEALRAYTERVAELREEVEREAVGPPPNVLLLSLLQSMAGSWLTTPLDPLGVLHGRPVPAEELDRARRLLREAATRVVLAVTAGDGGSPVPD